MKSVWVTANVLGHKDHSYRFVPFAGAHEDEEKGMGEPDEVIVIDPEKDKIIKRISISPEVHLAHVVLTQDNAFAYVTAQKEGAVYKINAKTFAVEKKIAMPKGSEPHGLRVAPDNSVVYLAMLMGKSLGILDLKTDSFSEVSLKGEVVQTGVTPNGQFTFASLYDTKRLALYRADSKKVSYIDLPQSAKGPIQMYSTPDSRFVYLADQGYYFGEPTSEWVYKIDLEKSQVVAEIKAGKAPHGVVVSEDGKFVYVTNLLSGDVSIIDTTSDQEIARVKVGKEPNGISIWSKKK